MRARYLLVLLLVAGFIIKVYPPLANDFLVDYDSIYHTRIGQIVADTGFVPLWDPVAGGRPHLYPPLYHLLLGYTSMISGIPVFELIQFILPFVSALLIVPVFFLIRKFRSEESALWGAAFMAFSPIITSQSYDSPHLFGLLLLPLIVYFFLKGNYLVSGGLLAICVLFNYGIVITIVAVLGAFSILKFIRDKDRSFLLYTTMTCVVGLGLSSPWLVITASRMGQCFEPSMAVSSINEPGVPYLLVIAPFLVAIGAVLLYATRTGARYVKKGNKSDDYLTLWRTAFCLATIGFMASLFVPQLHPYDQILLFGFCMPFLLAELRLRREYKVIIVAIMVIGMVSSILAVKPALDGDEVAAAKWLAVNGKGGVLANLEMSSAINMFSGQPGTIAKPAGITTSFDQFLECVPNKQRWEDLDEALRTSDKQKAFALMEKNGIGYVITGPRDVHYGFDTEKFADMGFAEVFKAGDVRIYAFGNQSTAFDD